MSKFLIDSDVIIWHLRGEVKAKELLKRLQRAGIPACSSLSIIEVQAGVKEGEEEITAALLDSFKVYEVDREIAKRAGKYIMEYKRQGVTISIPDAVVAATSVINDLVLVTYNPKHYPMPEVKLYPW